MKPQMYTDEHRVYLRSSVVTFSLFVHVLTLEEPHSRSFALFAGKIFLPSFRMFRAFRGQDLPFLFVSIRVIRGQTSYLSFLSCISRAIPYPSVRLSLTFMRKSLKSNRVRQVPVLLLIAYKACKRLAKAHILIFYRRVARVLR
jgi:hypothetical protein